MENAINFVLFNISKFENCDIHTIQFNKTEFQ